MHARFIWPSCSAAESECTYAPSLICCLLAGNWADVLTTALAECQHARNRRMLHFQNAFSFFAALCMLADAKGAIGKSGRKKTTAKPVVVTASGVAERPKSLKAFS